MSEQSGIPLRWTLERDGLVLELEFQLGGPATLSLGVSPEAIAEESGYEMQLTHDHAESLAAALSAWSRS